MLSSLTFPRTEYQGSCKDKQKSMRGGEKEERAYPLKPRQGHQHLGGPAYVHWTNKLRCKSTYLKARRIIHVGEVTLKKGVIGAAEAMGVLQRRSGKVIIRKGEHVPKPCHRRQEVLGSGIDEGLPSPPAAWRLAHSQSCLRRSR